MRPLPAVSDAHTCFPFSRTPFRTKETTPVLIHVLMYKCYTTFTIQSDYLRVLCVNPKNGSLEERAQEAESPSPYTLLRRHRTPPRDPNSPKAPTLSNPSDPLS